MEWKDLELLKNMLEDDTVRQMTAEVDKMRQTGDVTMLQITFLLLTWDGGRRKAKDDAKKVNQEETILGVILRKMEV